MTCDYCECEPIRGTRFKCQQCKDVDLCRSCHDMHRACVRRSQAPPAIASSAEVYGALSTDVANISLLDVGLAKDESRELAEADVADRSRGWPPSVENEVSKAASAEADYPETLHPVTHTFVRVAGPERAVRLLLRTGQSTELRNECVRRYLKTFPPSQASCKDLAWIVVSAHQDSIGMQCDRNGVQGESSLTNTDLLLDDRIDCAIEQWERTLAESSAQPTTAVVDEIALKNSILVC